MKVCPDCEGTGVVEQEFVATGRLKEAPPQAAACAARRRAGGSGQVAVAGRAARPGGSGDNASTEPRTAALMAPAGRLKHNARSGIWADFVL